MDKFILKSKFNAYLVTAIICFVLSLLVYMMVGDIFETKEETGKKENTEISVNMDDTTQMDDYSKIISSQKIESDLSISAENPYGKFDENQAKIDSEKAQMARMIQQQNASIANQNRTGLTENYPRYQSTPQRKTNYEINDRRYSDVYQSNPTQNTVPVLSEPKKKGFNTISSDNGSSSSIVENNKKTNSKLIKVIVPMTQVLQSGSKVKLKLKERLGEANEGDIVVGIVKMSSSEFNIVISGSQFGLTENYYVYFNNIKGMSYSQETMLDEMKDDARRQLGGDIQATVSSIPIIGGLGSRIIGRLGNSSKSQTISLELVAGERLTIGE